MKFYEFKNITSNEADLYVYGEIVSEHDEWFGSEGDCSLTDFKEELDSLGNINTLNMFINSPGGDVFTASTMISMLNRLKSTGTIINAYVDGLSASAASFLMMVANNIYLYKNSIVMVHKPMSISIGNVHDMQKTIDALNKIEDSVMLPMYMDKAKISEEEIKQLINDESWLNSNQMNEYFDVIQLEEEKTAIASISSSLFKNYKNTPEFIKNSLKNIENDEKNIIFEENGGEIEKNNTKPTVFEEKESNSNENEQISEKLKKENEIKTKLDLIKNSLLIKNIEERGDDENE